MKLTWKLLIRLAATLAWANGVRATEPPKPPAAKKAADVTATPGAKKRVLVTISKETTYITAPLREDGYVDYVAALNERCRKGVTPKNNSAVPFIEAMGPGMMGEKIRGRYFQMLGIPPLPENGKYYVTLDQYVKLLNAAKDSATPIKPGDVDDQQAQAMKRPWSKEEFPILAGWIAANEKPLELLVAASKRPRRYDPLVSSDGIVISILLPAVQQAREAARGLTTRAMLRLNEGKADAAWADLLAVHRLARLTGQGPTLIEALVAIAIDGIASAGDLALLQHPKLTAAQIVAMKADLDRLPPMPKMVDKLDLCERFMFLDCVGMVARQGFHSLSAIEGSGNKPQSTIESLVDSLATHTIDWDVSLRMGNSWYDRLTAACGKPTRAEREAAFQKIDADIHKMAGSIKDPKSIGLSLLNGPQQAVSERIGQVFVALLLPALSSAVKAEERGAMQLELTRLAFALAAYHADHGAYPAKLADLAPKYIALVPQDIFSTAALHYRQEGAGYLLYSVGPNGKDDGGRTRDDSKAGEGWDDLVVRVPTAKASPPAQR